MGSLPKENEKYSPNSHHVSLLQTLGHDIGMMGEILVRSYSKSFNGFAANLTSQEARKLESMEEVVSIFESRIFRTQTTRSWDYLGFSIDVPRNPRIESDIIIGSIDGGITPESKSFSDLGLNIIPKKWKGVCLGGTNFTCNKKLIGVRHYVDKDARDNDGHGTHTASTAAGRLVPNANFFGLGNGIARGAVPSARIAAYKACTFGICLEQNILAAFDDAIADGVDIITISLGVGFPQILSKDAVSIGSFHAIEKNILTVHCAGNNGNDGLGTVESNAPWLLTAAASSIDRKIINKLILGNQRTLLSLAVNAFPTTVKNMILVHGGTISKTCNQSSAMQCVDGCVDPKLVKGKIIVCDTNDESGAIEVVMDAGAAGVILSNGKIDNDISYVVPLMAAIVNDSDFPYVKSYINSTRFPQARITKSEIIPLHEAPAVAGFSGRGPNRILPQILKPDITAPGIDILAAYSPLGELSDYTSFSDKRISNYTFLSGTSMACPHVAGTAAYVKSIHPDWSPSAIKSAIMTTASPMNVPYNLDVELGYGAGQIDPLKATNPGLIYETFINDYINMFCSLGYEGNKLIQIFKLQSCPKGNKIIPKDLNYPSMATPVQQNSSFIINFSRTVTNVGHGNSTYNANINMVDKTINVKVEPSVLSFVKLNERKSFVVTVSGKWLNQDHVSGSLVWSDGTYRVRSPILLYRGSII
ncbi:subtilisin-like protease SBT4.3 [Impatiens glandulifera]|uniref:subtilisin-like protease SBT4.3 n=1 Tax=Impatiens glandulifera TaxID=253017 RepID=UPI001FB07ED2|nr:subtilisin-like protease SBT4.3 [Impatiens glandulifera]